MSCCLYWVILEERLSVRVLASTVEDNNKNSTGSFSAKVSFMTFVWS